VRTAHSRAEQINEKFDFIVSRAVTRLGEFYPWIKGKFSKDSKNKLPNGILYLKGGDLADEIRESGLTVTQYHLKDYYTEEFFDTKQVIYVKG
jgi:16S rRNA (guanine527-N7)-methyltransferase